MTGKFSSYACCNTTLSINLPYLCYSFSSLTFAFNFSFSESSTFPRMPPKEACGMGLAGVQMTWCEREYILRVGEGRGSMK